MLKSMDASVLGPMKNETDLKLDQNYSKQTFLVKF